MLMPIIMKPYSHPDKLVVRDSLDDELSEDVEDDVFIRDGKMCKNFEDKRLKRPLMPPKRNKNFGSVPILKKHTKCWRFCEPLCYGFVAIIVLLALIFLAAILLTMFPIPLQKIKIWLRRDQSFSQNNNNNNNNIIKNYVGNLEVVPCSQIQVHKVWSKAISRINSETPVRSVDINSDGKDDIVIGYGIDELTQMNDNEAPKCSVTKTGETVNCEGGLLALNGVTGETLWQRWTTFTIFSLYCSVDLTGDEQYDCVAAGRGGLIIAVNGRNGNILWQLSDNLIENNDLLTNSYIIDLYTINPVRDLDGDQISDIISVHVEETITKKSGHIKLISGSTGKIIQSIPTPHHEEVFVPLQFITQPDGTESLLIITGGQNSPGGLYSIRLNSLMQYTNENDFTTIYHSDLSGFMVPAVLVDITGDGIEDIIVSSFNSTVYSFNGRSNEIIWTYTFPASESVSSVVPGHFDNDNVTDFMIKYNTGPGFPVYYYSQTTILSGISGIPLIDEMITDAGGPNSLLGGVSISQSYGGDFFLHWQTQCKDKLNAKDAYQFYPDSDIVQQSRADICMLRYNTSTVLNLYAIARHVEPPGGIIFSTDDLILQLNQTITKNINKINPIFPLKHPKMRLPKIVNKELIQETVNNDLTDNINTNNININNNNIEKKRIQNQKDEIINENKNDFDETKRRKIMLPQNRKMISIENKNERMKDEKPYIYLPYDESERPYKPEIPYDVDQKEPPEYEIFYDEAERQIARNRNSNNNNNNNRDIRKSGRMPNDMNYNHFNHTIKKEIHPETLWDLEIEKETAESLNDNGNYDYPSRQEFNKIADKKKRDTNNENTNQNLLSSISSTGILVKPIEVAESTIDFVFVLNVRESEIFPPLFLPEDVLCVEESIRNYGNYGVDGESQILTQCLQKRLPNLIQNQQKYETQIVITRISITCSCGKLNTNEICSKLNSINKQKWNGFMGNYGNGIYPI